MDDKRLRFILSEFCSILHMCILMNAYFFECSLLLKGLNKSLEPYTAEDRSVAWALGKSRFGLQRTAGLTARERKMKKINTTFY